MEQNEEARFRDRKSGCWRVRDIAVILVSGDPFYVVLLWVMST